MDATTHSAQQERAEMVAYLRRRAEWLRREAFNGGSRLLIERVDELDGLAAQIDNGRHLEEGP